MIIELKVGGNTAQLGYATTRQLMEELAVRMKVTQNSIKGREIGDLCDLCIEALHNLAPGVLNYSTMRPEGLSGRGA